MVTVAQLLGHTRDRLISAKVGMDKAMLQEMY